jgi:sugar phosphate isomerase/epimerase
MHPAPNGSACAPDLTISTSVTDSRWPIIGVTSQVIRLSKWYKSATQLGFDALEINRRDSKLHLNTFFLEKVKRYLKDLKVSLHSATTGIFQELDSFSEAELAMLHAEVDVSRIFGAKELVFHINPSRLDQRRSRRLRPVVDYAHDNGILPIYESSAGINAKQVLKVLDLFPDIGYALDIGHLNNGWGRNLLGCSIDEFVEAVKHRVVYIHANNNDGIGDQHLGLDHGSLDWRAVLDRLDIHQIRKIIIEVCSADYLDSSRCALRHYLEKRSAGCSCLKTKI